MNKFFDWLCEGTSSAVVTQILVGSVLGTAIALSIVLGIVKALR